MAEQTASQAKLVQYLTEAHGKEKELETALTAHIELASRPAYKKRLKQHLKETKQHARQVERRLKKLGGPKAVAQVAEKVTDVVSRGVATAKGPVEAARGVSPEEKQLKNARTEFKEEHEEIAMYVAIETLAEQVGDKETAKLAKGIRREEERMAAFLEKQIPILTKEVAKAEIPASERSSGTRSRRRSSSSRRSGSSAGSTKSSSTKSSSSRKSAAKGSSRKSGAKRSSPRSRSGSGRSSGTGSRSGGGRSGSRPRRSGS
jgi:ferritin-like metal-binding protein YciE